jgi:hypothetical protein
VASFLRWCALIAFILAALAAIPPLVRLGRVPWLPIGLALWMWAEIVRLGGDLPD